MKSGQERRRRGILSIRESPWNAFRSERAVKIAGWKDWRWPLGHPVSGCVPAAMIARLYETVKVAPFVQFEVTPVRDTVLGVQHRVEPAEFSRRSFGFRASMAGAPLKCQSRREPCTNASIFSVVANLFRIGCQKVSAPNHRIPRSCAFSKWREVSAAC